MELLIGFIAALLGTGVAVIYLRKLAPALGLIDHPCHRKHHADPVPLVGGLAVFATLCVAFLLLPTVRDQWPLLLAVALLVAVGTGDDAHELRPAVRFAAQIVACLAMIYVAGVEIESVGNLIGFGPIGMWVFAVPITVFAVVGVINAVNMIDGADGLAGSVSLVALAWYGGMAQLSGFVGLMTVAIVLCGALAGFLAFNLRFPWQPKARVFLGDAGSTLLGFVLAWMAVTLTQGPAGSVPPISALWVLLLPLADTVSLCARRLRRGQSPFEANREHIHHLLLALGLTHTQTLLALVAGSALFGAVGFFGWRLGISEPILFWAFFCLFFAYHFAVQAAWKRLHDRRPASVLAVTFGRASEPAD
jgi:UDP-GlcNAc:undecaprenyl-phosphate GlcNAc-1-phosphate transferase